MKRISFVPGVVLVLLFVVPGVGLAVNLFGVDVSYNDQTISTMASSLPKLVEALVRNEGDFAPLAGNDFTGSLFYYGIPDAVLIEVQGDTQLRLTSPLTGLDRTFTGANRRDLESQLTDWLLQEGDSEVAALLQAASERSVAAVIDGNPSAATARMAQRAFGTFGLYPGTRALRGSTPGQGGAVWFHGRRAKADLPVGRANSSDYELQVPWYLDLGRRVSLIGSGSGRYLDTEGTDIYGGGIDLGLGIHLATPGPDDKFAWQVTPFAGLHGIGTYDGAAGGLLNQFGIANRLEFKLSDDILLVVANQLSHFDSLKFEIENVKIDPRVDQQIVKNAVMIDVPLSATGWLYANGFVADTRFLQDAAVSNYQTLGGGLALRRKRTSLNAYVSRDFAGDYRSWNAGVGLAFGM